MGAKRKAAAPESAAVTAAEVLPVEKHVEVQTEEPAAVPAYEAHAGYVEAPCVVCAGNGLYLRKGPGRAFPAAAVLPDGTPVTALGLPYGVEVPGWVLVAAPAGFGWVCRESLAEAEA